MPKGPKGRKRPADVGSNAIKVARIAAGEEDDAPPAPAKTRTPPLKGRRALIVAL